MKTLLKISLAPLVFIALPLTLQAQDVLVIEDGGTETTINSILTGNGYSVTSVSDDAIYNGTNPSPDAFQAVILLDGVDLGENMPTAGQDTLVSYVQNGGGFITMEWLAFEISNGRYANMTDLVPVSRSSGANVTDDYTVVETSHPIVQGVSTSFSVNAQTNIGTANSGTVIATATNAGDAIVAKELVDGRIVYFSVAGNFNGKDPFAVTEMEQILLNSLAWISTTPETPTSLAASTVSGAQIDLTWNDNSDNETGYVIERSINVNSSFAEIATIAVNSTGYSDMGLASGTTYFYRVKATNTLDESDYSNESNATTTPNSLPTDIILSSSSIPEKEAIGAEVGTLSTTDADGGDVHTYTLVSGTGDQDNGSFSITGTSLESAEVFDFETKSSYSIRIETDDGNSGKYEEAFTITITDANDDPTDLALNSTSVDENQDPGATVGGLTSTDPDAGETFIYTLVSGTGDTDNSSFSIDGSNLVTNEKFNFETKSTYSVRIQTDDGEGMPVAKDFAISVNDLADPPTDLSLSSSSIAEDQAVGSTVGQMTTTDEDNGETHTYQLVTGEGDDDNASFVVNGSNLQTNVALNFEEKATYSVRLQTDDGNTNTFQKPFSITIVDANDVPTDINMSSTTVVQGLAAGTTVGVLSTTDQDAGDAHTYILVTGSGGEDNASFGISGSQLVTAEEFDAEVKDSYAILVQTNDGNGGTHNKTFSISISKVPNTAPSDISLSTQTVAENEPAGALVGIFSSEDVDVDNVFSYSLVEGVGGEDNVSFTISNDSLKATSILDFEGQSEYSILVQTNDGAGGTFEKEFSITVTNANDPPTELTLSHDSIQENRPVGTVIGSFETSDQDAADNHIYTLLAGGSDFSIDGNELKTAKVLSAADKASIGITIRTDDGSGGQLDKEFTIFIIPTTDAEEPVISTSSIPNFFDSGSGTITITATITDNVGIDQVSFSYRGITQPVSGIQSIDPSIDGDNFSVDLAETLFDKLGLEYTISATDLSGNTSETNGRILRRFSANTPEAIPGLTFGGTQASYQIISIPYDLENGNISTVFAELGGFDKKRWRLLRHRSDGLSFDEFTKGLSRIEPGNGYWLNVKDRTTIEIGQRTIVQSSQDEPFEITLVPGWNQIGNPYPFDVSWSDVLEINQSPEDLGTLKVFNRGSFTIGTTLRSFGGGFVRWEGASTYQLKIPMTGSGSGGRSGLVDNTSDIDTQDWEVRLAVSGAGLSNKLSGFGMHPEAKSSMDRFDDITVPRLFDYLEINFQHPEYASPRFSKDIVPTAESHTWKFEVETNLQDQIELSWDNSYFGDHDLNLVLIDRENQTRIDMKERDYYTFHSTGSRKFEIYYGNRSFIDQELKPNLIVLGESYPNPFDYQTTIPLALPSNEQNYQVRLSIHDLMGQEVIRLVDRQLENGFHSILWDRSNSGGAAVPRGIYLIQLEVEGMLVDQRQNNRLIIK